MGERKKEKKNCPSTPLRALQRFFLKRKKKKLASGLTEKNKGKKVSLFSFQPSPNQVVLPGSYLQQ